jgi:hypothetical protein
VPLTHGWSYFLAPFLALALVGGLALVLKWTFNDVDLDDEDDEDVSAPRDPTADDLLSSDLLGGDLAGPERAASPAGVGLPAEDLLGPSPVAIPDPGGGSPDAVADDPDDYGLLSVVTVTDTATSAHAATTLLAEAGIRATVTTGADGRIRVLVFENDLYRARRVVGWPA